MATGAAFDHAVRLARENPDLDIGCHLVLVGGEGFPPTVAALIAAIARRRIRIYDELAAQARKILDAGIRPTHLDTHKHTHALPPVLEVVARISEEFGIPWVRRPFDLPIPAPAASWKTRLGRRALSMAQPRFDTVLSRRRCRTTDHFAGFRLTGRYGAADLEGLIRGLPEGSTEFMCHPGFCRAELRASHTRLKESREREMEALKSAEVRAALAESGVILTNYARLSVIN
jgi:chitin disaccharide deacetylase